MHGCTHGQRHGRTTRKHIASAGSYRRRRLKNKPMMGKTGVDRSEELKITEEENDVENWKWKKKLKLYALNYNYLYRHLASEGIVTLGDTLCVSAALVSAVKVMRCIQHSLVRSCIAGSCLFSNHKLHDVILHKNIWLCTLHLLINTALTD